MITSKVVGDDIFHSFQMFIKFIPQVALEMMSKAGNEVRERQRSALIHSRRVTIVTAEDLKGRKYLRKVNYDLPFGHRESENKTASPDNMANMINSYLMETSMTMVVNGTHPTFIPVLRKDGEIVGVGSKVKGVGKKTHAILQRMNDDKMDSFYPVEDMLNRGEPIGQHYAQFGNRLAQPKVRRYLVETCGEALKRVEQKHRKQIRATI